MKRKVIIAGVQQTATAAGGPRNTRSKKSKDKLATNPVMGALKGVVEDALELHEELEAAVDKTGENLENIEFALKSENWVLNAPGAANAKTAIAAVAKLQKSLYKNILALRTASAKAMAELEKGRVKEAAPVEEAEEETEEE